MSRAGYEGRRRKGHGGHEHRGKRQRSIRSTIMILLVIPLVSLVALWAYAATSTVAGAFAKRNADTLNKDFQGPLSNLTIQVDTERALTYAWQSAHGRMPRTSLVGQRALTDKAIAVYRAAALNAEGVEQSAAKRLDDNILAVLAGFPQLRAKVDAGKIAPLAAFQAYNAFPAATRPFSGALTDPNAAISLYSEGQAQIEIGSAIDDITQEATLMGGAALSGGIMAPAVHQAFTQAVINQHLFEELGNNPLQWQQSPDVFLKVFASPGFAALQKMENAIVATRPGTRIPVNPLTWQSTVTAVDNQFIAGEVVAAHGVTAGDAHAGNIILLRLVLVGGAGLLAVIVSSVLLLGFGNRISRELTGLRSAARALAGQRLPSVVSRLRAGEDVDVAAEAPPLDLGTRTREVTDTADAFSVVQRTAVEAAVEQAQLRKGVSMVFRSLSRRNQSLLQRQLKLLDEMERSTEDPDALEQLFRLDHLTTRMRRQAEGLIILSGAAPGRTWRQPVPVVEVLRGAIGEIEDYARVDLLTDSPDFMQGTAVADVTHMLAELVENAVLYSPPNTRVQVRGGRVANGYVIEIEDRGLGIPPDTMAMLNERLAQPPEFDLADSDQLGLFVVSRLAIRHGVRVSLRVSGYGGTTAIVLLPRDLVVAEEEVPFLVAKGPGDSAGAGRAMGAGAPTAAGVAAAALAGRRRQLPERALNPSYAAERIVDLPEDWPVPRGGVQTLPSRGSGLQDSQPSATAPSGLPRRQAGTNMAKQLRENRPGTPPGPLAGRSPEQARALMSAIQQGLRSGRGVPPDQVEDPGPGHGWNE
jgi:signal transduction histidine kinase